MSELEVPALVARFKYAGGTLDRAGAERRDPRWVEAQRADPAARVIPVWRDHILIDDPDGDDPRAGFRDLAAITAIDPTATVTLLGLDERRTPIFAADLGDISEQSANEIAGPGRFMKLRQVGPLLSLDQAALLGYANGMITWHRHARFCGDCGAATEVDEGGNVRRCTAPGCGTHIYPRTDPAVIMLVEHPATDDAPARCLLARHARLPSGMYSTLAGFVEPGESLEEAVVREVREETGVEVDEVRYFGSQPWPFPRSLMIGFRARATTEAIHVDPDELQEARWFTAAQITGFGDSGDETAAFRLPRADSIARALVDGWVAEQLTSK